VERREEEVAGRLFTPGDYAMSSNLGDIIIIIADSIPLSDDHSVFHSFITKEYVSTIVLQEYVWLKTIEPMLKKEGMNDRRVDVVAHFCNFLFGEDATGHIYAKEKLCIISGIPRTS
jgi:hypothetical protein